MKNSLLTCLFYPKKEIPENAVLFRAVHYTLIDSEKFRPSASAFNDVELSCDWDKYATPESSRELISKQYKGDTKTFKNKEDYFISSIQVNQSGDLVPLQEFIHDPLFQIPQKIGYPNNRAHSLIKGNKDQKSSVKAKKQLANRANWEIFNPEIFLKLKK